jgi:hypothetical protein
MTKALALHEQTTYKQRTLRIFAARNLENNKHKETVHNPNKLAKNLKKYRNRHKKIKKQK